MGSWAPQGSPKPSGSLLFTGPAASGILLPHWLLCLRVPWAVALALSWTRARLPTEDPMMARAQATGQGAPWAPVADSLCGDQVTFLPNQRTGDRVKGLAGRQPLPSLDGWPGLSTYP